MIAVSRETMQEHLGQAHLVAVAVVIVVYPLVLLVSIIIYERIFMCQW